MQLEREPLLGQRSQRVRVDWPQWSDHSGCAFVNRAEQKIPVDR